MGIATTYANAHNVGKLTETLDQYKGKMAEMKEVLRKEERVGRELNRKYEATLSNYEKLQQDHQSLREERDELKLSNMAFEKENQKLESKITEVEGHKSAVDQKAEEYIDRITELEAHKSSLEVLFKASND